jgi:hypothetical protein
MNLTNEAILALLLELKADIDGIKGDVATLKANDEAMADRVRLIDKKLTYLAEFLNAF